MKGTLLAAVCLLLLDTPECGKPSGSCMVETAASSWLGKLSGRLMGVCSVSTAEEVGEVQLITYGLELGRPLGQTTHSSERVHRGFLCSFFPWTLRTLKVVTMSRKVRIGLVGKDDKERSTTFNNDIKERDGSEHRKVDADSFHPKSS